MLYLILIINIKINFLSLLFGYKKHILFAYLLSNLPSKESKYK